MSADIAAMPPPVVPNPGSEPVDVLSAFDAMILDDMVVDEPTEALPAIEAVEFDSDASEVEAPESENDLSVMPPPLPSMAAPSVTAAGLDAMAPPTVAASAAGSALPDAVFEGLSSRRSSKDDVELDPRALKALSRQERKDAKSAIRREAKEAREAARRARAEAKAGAKADLTDDAEDLEFALEPAAPIDHIDPVAEAAELLAEAPADMPPPAIAADVEPAPIVAPPAETPTAAVSAPMPPPTPAGNDPRSRAAARVQRRLGRDAEKVSAAETRARAREEARRRRVQAKELRTGSVGVEAAEAVVRMPDELPDITAEIPVLDEPFEAAETELIQPIADAPDLTFDEIVADETVADETVADETVVIEAVETEVEPEVDETFFDDFSDPEAEAAEFVPPTSDDPIFDLDDDVSTQPVLEEMPAPVVSAPTVVPVETTKPAASKWAPEPIEEPAKRSGLGPIAGVIGLIALAISVLLAVSALAVALGVDSGGVYNALQSVADVLVGPLKSAFEFSGSNAERKEHFLAWGTGSLGYLVLSFIGQAVQRANSDDE